MIASMERLEVVCLRSVLHEVVAFLQDWGMLHVEDVPLAVENAPGFLHRIHLTGDQRAELEAIEQLNGTLTEIAPLLASRPNPNTVTEAASALRGGSPREWTRQARRWSRTLRSLTRRRANVRDNLEVVADSRRFFVDLASLLGDREVVLGRTGRALLLKGDSGRDVAHLKRRMLSELGPQAHCHTRKIAHGEMVGLITYPEGEDEAAGRLIADEGITPVDLPSKELHDLTLQQVLDKLESDVASLRQSLTEIEAELKEFSAEKGAELRAMKMVVADRLVRLRVLEHFAVSERAAVIHGWVPRDVTEELDVGLKERFGEKAVVAPLSQHDVDAERIPTLLRTSRVMEPFQLLLSLFKPPTYGTLDPSIMVGVCFVLFYGFILGDVGYGLAVIGLALLVRYRWGHIKPLHAAGTIAVYCGTSAIVFGVLFGEFLGDVGAGLGMRPIWFHRGHDPERLLVIAVAAGAVHVVLSLVLSIREHLRHRHHQHANEKLGLLLGLFGVGVGALGVGGVAPFDTLPARIVMLIFLLASAALLFRAAGPMAPVHMLEVVSLVGNVLSYSRLMALGIASIVLADVANSMVTTMGNVVLGVIMATIVHTVNIGMGLFSPTIHALRLNYVEFLPRFYTPEGRSYDPLRKEAP